MDTKGFYKLTEETGNYVRNSDGQSVQIDFAPNFVSAPDYDIVIENSNVYEYPIHGWYYFISEEAMLTYFNIKKIEVATNKTPIE